MKTIRADLIQSVHDAILLHSKGLKGNVPSKSVDSVAARVEMAIHYSETPLDAFDVAAMYCIAINKGHVFNDGNKRTSMIIMEHYLAFYDRIITAKDIELADKMVEVADDQIDQQQLSNWLRNNTIHV